VRLKGKNMLLSFTAALLILGAWPAGAQDSTGETPEETPPAEGEETTVEETTAAPEEGAAAEVEATPPTEETAPPAEAEAEEPAVEAEVAVETEPPAGAAAEVGLEAEAKPEKPSPFRNSYVIYENTFSAYSLNKKAQLTYDPYYAMSYSFRPRYYIYQGLYVALRWDLEQELTNADDTTRKHQVMWTDVILDLAWTGVYKIPAVDVLITPKIRIALPASLASQAHTMYLSLGPGFDLVRIFDVWGGITLEYSFRFTKYFNEYTSTLSEEPVLACPEKGPCQYDVMGPQNASWQFLNDFYLEIRPINQFYFGATVEVRNYLNYKVPRAEVETLTGTVDIPSTGTRHSGYMWYIFEFGYDIKPYLTVSLGTNTYNPMLNPDSEYYPPFFNRFTNIYLDLSLDMDGMINAIIKKGGAKEKTATDRL
jgi:hypothetical protein